MPERTEHVIHFAALGSRDAGRIARLQRKLFPRELTEPEPEIRQILKNTEEHLVCNLSFGLFDGTRMVGYLFAYVESASLFHEREEEVIYIKEIALMPSYERYLRPLFQRLFEQWVVFTPDMPVEAHAVEEALAKWKRLARVFRYFGLGLSSRDAGKKPGQPDYKLLRLDIVNSACRLREQSLPLPKQRWVHNDDVTVTVVRDPRQWLSLKDRWNELLHETRGSNVFQTFEYLWEWWQCFGIWKDLRVIVIRRGETVIGAAPLMIEYVPIFGRIARKWRFLTTPMEMNRPAFLFGRNADTCLPALLAWFAAHSHQWDILDIDEQLEGEHTGAIRGHFRRQGCQVAESETLCPYIELEGGWDEFFRGRSRRMRGNVKRLRRRMESLGDVCVRLVEPSPNAEESLDLYCDVESRSWKAREDLDLWSDRSHYFFYRGLAKQFAGDNRFQMRVLECGGRAIAATFGIAYAGVYQSLKIAHDRNYDRMSPGTVLESFELEALFGSDVSRYEFMGSFLTNKLRWTSSVVTTTNMHVYQRQPRLMLFYFVYFVGKRKVKALLKRAGQFERAERYLGRLANSRLVRH